MRKILSFVAAMLFAFAANATTWNITPTHCHEGDRDDCTLYVTLDRGAQAGDTIVLADGTYHETLTTTISNPVVIMAAEGAHPVVEMSGYFKVYASAEFEGLKFKFVGDSGNGYCMYFYDNTSKYLKLEGCEFQDYTQYCVSSWEDYHIDSCIVNNCYFHDLAKAPFYFAASSLENNVNACDKLKVTNSTFANIAVVGYVAVLDIRNNSGNVTGATSKLEVDHCTFYNCQGDYERMIQSYKSPDATISNCIMMNPIVEGKTEIYATYLYGGSIHHNLNYQTKRQYGSGVTVTDSIQRDPLFVDAANLDLHLGDGSPALGAGSDGSNLGDPRWWPVVGAPVYYLVGTMNNWTPADEYKFEENSGAEGEYMLTAALAVGDEIKVKGIVGATETWYPAGTGNNYVVDADHAGEWKKIYFRPEGQGGEDWHYGFFFVEENPAPVVEFDTIYTWYGKRGESAATEAIEKGGVATAEGGNSNIVVGTAQKTNWTIKLNKGFSNANYVGITLDEALKAGDQMQLAAFIASDNTAVLGIDFSESKEAASTDCQLLFSNLQLISTNAAPEDTLFTIPAAAAGAKYIRVYRNSGQTGVYIANITILRNGDTPEPPAPEPKFCVTGDSALVVDAGAEASKAWAADAVPSMTDTLVLNLKANQYYVLKLVDGANWLGYHDLSEVAPGLVEDSPEEYHNIGFTLAEAGEVKVIYTEGVPNKIFKLEGNFYVEPVAGCDWDNIDFLADASIEQAFANQFKVCKDGAEPNVANVQSPDWADTTGIYVNFPDAVIGEISLPEGQYKQQGAGILLYVTAFTLKETEFTIQWQDGIYTLTVLNVNGEEPEPEHTYTAVGDELVFGSNWKVDDENNDMEKQADGTYKWTADSIVLIANTYAYKIVKDHSWAGEWPVGQGNNKTFAIAETGYYDVTITFNPEAAEDEKAVVEAVKVGDAVVIPTVAMHGDFTGSWKDTELFTNAADSSCASLKLNLEAKTYEFGMRIGSASNWTANSANLTRENPSTVLSVGASGNMHIIADQAGEYTFTYFYDADSLVVTYPAIPQHYDVAEAIAAQLEDSVQIYVRGIVTKISFKGKNFDKYGSANIFVADATGAEGEFEFFNCYSLNADTFRTSSPDYDAASTSWAEFNSVADENGVEVALGDTIEAFGKFKLYGNTYELLTGCYITVLKKYVEPIGAPEYFLVGTMNEWEPADGFKFEPNPGAEGEYMLNATLSVGDSLKVLEIVGNTRTYYPDLAPNYGVDSLHAGESKKIYFRPDGQGGEGWYYGYFFVEENQEPADTIPTTAPAVPTAAEDDVMAIYCNHYTNNNLNFVISDFGGSAEDEDLDIQGTRVGYMRHMTWDCIIDPINTDSIHDLSGYKKLHVDIWAPEAAKVKFTAEAVAGGNYKDGKKVDLNAGWNSFDFVIAEWPGNYDFSNLKCFVFEQYQTPEEASFEGNPFAFANIYFYEKEAQGIENIDANAPAVKSLENGVLIIRKGGKAYTITGQLLK